MPDFLFVRPLAVFLYLCMFVLPSAGQAKTQWISLKGDPDYADIQAQLLVLANIDGFHADNEFCVVGEHDDDGETALVYWPTEDKLINWDHKIDDPEALVDAKTLLYLNSDVVATEGEIDGSTYLVTSAWVNDVIHNCNRFGNRYHITKSDSGWKSPEDFPQFSTLNTQLQSLLAPPDWLLNADPRTVRPSQQINKFCVIAQKDRSWLAAYVYWETKHRLILWLPKADDDDALLLSYGSLDLQHGIASSATPHGPIYQMPQHYMQNIISACLSKGISLTIQTNSKENSK